MSDSRLSRRTLVYGSGAIAIGGTLINEAGPAGAQHGHAPATPVGTPSADGAMTRGTDDGGYQFFGGAQAELVAAMGGRIMPSDDAGPGAVEAGAVFYIDRALAGFYADDRVTYQRGLLAVDRFALERSGGAFVDLTPQQQDVLTAMEDGTATGFDVPAPDVFFNLVRRHVMEGFLADPVYGANRDFIGWKTVNFAGAAFVYSAEEMQNSQVLDKPFVSLAQWHAPTG